jgi:L-seryl-tRNA(Ser) seleniumtransferase
MDDAIKKDLLKTIPKVDEILNLFHTDAPYSLKLKAVREAIAQTRQNILSGIITENVTNDGVLKLSAYILSLIEKPSLKRVVNATGVVVHTNLGRSLLPEYLLQDLAEIANLYSNLEYNLELGKRGSRYTHVEDILCELTGAEAGLVVNNNAAAVLIILDTMANGKEVIVSRGELVEIGGSFRVPDVMKKSNAILKEIGTTNRTHLHDYENAVTPETALFMKVHQSNFHIMGFTKMVAVKELKEISFKTNIPIFEDLGSGSFVDFSKYGMKYEPTVQDTIKQGADIVSFSGDKLLGGPQAGIIVGNKEHINKIKKNPLNRALRIDKLTLVALERILLLYRDMDRAVKTIPTLKMLTYSQQELRHKADFLNNKISGLNLELFQNEVCETISKVGGGALPHQALKTFAIKLMPEKGISANNMEEYLRDYKIPVIVRIEEDSIIMDVRTIQDTDIDVILNALTAFNKEQSV